MRLTNQNTNEIVQHKKGKDCMYADKRLPMLNSTLRSDLGVIKNRGKIVINASLQEVSRIQDKINFTESSNLFCPECGCPLEEI